MALKTMFQHSGKFINVSVPSVSVNTTRGIKYVNSITLLGRVGKEPMRVGAHDSVTFPMYTEYLAKTVDGSLKVYPSWHKVLVARKGLANAVFDNLERGQRCYVSGRVVYRAAKDGPDGKVHNTYQAAIIVEDMIFLEKSRKGLDLVKETPKEDEAAESIV